MQESTEKGAAAVPMVGLQSPVVQEVEEAEVVPYPLDPDGEHSGSSQHPCCSCRGLCLDPFLGWAVNLVHVLAAVLCAVAAVTVGSGSVLAANSNRLCK